MKMQRRKYEKVTLSFITNSFEEGWNSARSSLLSLQELFPTEEDEYEVKAKALEIFNNNIPYAEVGEKIQNSFWNLAIQSNKFYLRTNKLIFGYNVSIDIGEGGIVQDTEYTFLVTLLAGKEDYAKKLLLNNGWKETTVADVKKSYTVSNKEIDNTTSDPEEEVQEEDVTYEGVTLLVTEEIDTADECSTEPEPEPVE